MEKKIVIANCKDCPFKDHQGGFGRISYIPTCDKKERKKLPYTVSGSGGSLTAMPTGKIPKWCPLQDNSTTQTPNEKEQ